MKHHLKVLLALTLLALAVSWATAERGMDDRTQPPLERHATLTD